MEAQDTGREEILFEALSKRLQHLTAPVTLFLIEIIQFKTLTPALRWSLWAAAAANKRRVTSVCAQLDPTLCKSMDCSQPGSPVPAVFQTRILERAAFSSSRRSSSPETKPLVLRLLPWRVGSLPLLPPGYVLGVFPSFSSISLISSWLRIHSPRQPSTKYHQNFLKGLD